MSRATSLVGAGGAVVLTGAGISVDSGIPDFRSPGGLWERYPIEEYATIHAFKQDPAKVWRLFDELEELLGQAEPNGGHLALARLEAVGLVDAIVTQNIDNLHQSAGSRKVIEYHGSTQRLVCIACQKTYPASHRKKAGKGAIPRCACGQALKPDVVLFDEYIPPEAEHQARRAMDKARCCIVCGTSATVYPAAALPLRAQSVGAPIIEINLAPTPLSAQIADVFLQGTTTEVLSELARRVLEARKADSPPAQGVE